MITLDQREFDATLQKYLRVTGKPIAHVLNTKALYIARRAQKLTPAANRAEIEALGVSYQTHSKSGKALKRRKNIYDTSGRAKAILVANLRRAGKLAGVTDLDAAVRKMLASRLRAINSLKAGWGAIIRRFATVVAESGTQISMPRVKQSGLSKPAREGLNAQAELTYRVTVDSQGNAHIDPRVEAALNQAFADETRGMKEYIERKIQKTWDTVK